MDEGERMGMTVTEGLLEAPSRYRGRYLSQVRGRARPSAVPRARGKEMPTVNVGGA
ncbi:MAG: hypothetical protein ABFC89_03555 [Methanospirillum sp.]